MRRSPPACSPATSWRPITAAWLWSGRAGVFTGLSASWLHDAKWVATDSPVELNLPHNKTPPGVIARRETVFDGEIVRLRGMPATSAARTAFDLARRGPLGKAVERLDSLARATGFSNDEVLAVLDAHPGVRGRRRVTRLLELVDAGSQSPKETWLRLLLIDAGFPRPQTQIPVLDEAGYSRYYLDMGWKEFMVAVEYDGEQHRTDVVQYRGTGPVRIHRRAALAPDQGARGTSPR